MDQIVASKIEKFFDTYKVRHYTKGQILLLAGDKPHDIFYLTSGKVKEYDVTYRGDEIILNVFKPYAFFPMSRAFSDSPVNYVFEAETDVEIRQAPIAETLEFFTANPDVVLDLLTRLYSGVEGLLGRMSYLMAGSAKGRLLYELVIEARRFGTLQNDGSCVLAITEKDMGARAGLSRETVSRIIHTLKESGLVVIRSKDILIRNLLELEQSLGQEI